MIFSSNYQEHHFLKIFIQNLIFTIKSITNVNIKWQLLIIMIFPRNPCTSTFRIPKQINTGNKVFETYVEKKGKYISEYIEKHI